MTEPRDERQAWTAPHWAKAIKSEHRKTVESVLGVGQLLVAAKQILPHGEFQHIFVDLPFDIRMAEFYMSIARNKVLANAKWISHLPSVVVILYELSRIAEPVLETALTDGRIHPKLRRKDIRKLLDPKPHLHTWKLAAVEERLRQAINSELKQAPADARESIIALLQALIEEMQAAQDQSRRDDVHAARDDLELHDSDPGGYLVFEDETGAAFHPGAAAILTGMKSTHADWYRELTTKENGVTALRRKVVDRRLADLETGCLITRRTKTTYEAVLMAISGRARHSHYGKC